MTQPANWKPTSKQSRRLQCQAKACHEVCATAVQGSRGDVRLMEVFSPPRFAPVVDKMGMSARPCDLKTGYDLSTSRDCRKVEEDLVNNSPDLLVLSPPCTHEGGRFFGSKMWTKWEYLRLRARSRCFIRWCCKLFRMQVPLGGQALFEHPTGARTWSYEEVQSLCKKHITVKLHMCRYGVRLPESERLIRKSTRLLVSSKSMKSLAKLCPGKEDPKHACHVVVQGSFPGVPSVSAFSGAYSPQFVHAVLDTVPAFRDQPVFSVVEDAVPAAAWEEVRAVGRPA